MNMLKKIALAMTCLCGLSVGDAVYATVVIVLVVSLLVLLASIERRRGRISPGLISLLLLLGTQTWAPASNASLLLSWEFDPPSQTVSRTDIINVSATLFNDAASDQSIPTGIQSIGTVWTWLSTTAVLYNETGPVILPDDLNGLPPGGEAHFLFTVLTPAVPSVPVGSYRLFQTSFSLGGNGFNFILPGPDFVWTVGPGPFPAPEPATLALLGL